MDNVKLEPAPAQWDERPKGCWDTPHPRTREICQLPPDGHKTHKRLHPNGKELETWGSAD